MYPKRYETISQNPPKATLHRISTNIKAGTLLKHLYSSVSILFNNKRAKTVNWNNKAVKIAKYKKMSKY